MNIKTIAHNWARKYMKQQNKQTRFSLMNESERKLFLYVRETNIKMILSMRVKRQIEAEKFMASVREYNKREQKRYQAYYDSRQ